ncbi:MAG: sel1 repeat family protein [Oscillospiraceae bacterium]|jgi:TPR repeat protein|nr:sel1 repeat family protein [Oscillospiraceae bacterium]
MFFNDKSINDLKSKAESGDMEAQCYLADLYADDSRVDTFNITEAVYWYEKAAEQGHSRAQWLLGACYSQGVGVSKDLDKAESWLLKSAQAGDADGQYTLGGFYFMLPDIVKAEYWIGLAAEQEHGEAKAALVAIKQLM